MPRAAIVANKLSKWFGEGEARTYAVKEASFEACWGGDALHCRTFGQRQDDAAQHALRNFAT